MTELAVNDDARVEGAQRKAAASKWSTHTSLLAACSGRRRRWQVLRRLACVPSRAGVVGRTALASCTPRETEREGHGRGAINSEQPMRCSSEGSVQMQHVSRAYMCWTRVGMCDRITWPLSRVWFGSTGTQRSMISILVSSISQNCRVLVLQLHARTYRAKKAKSPCET